MPAKRVFLRRFAGFAVQQPGLAAAHHLVQHLHGIFEDAVGLAGVHFVGANLVGDVVDDVADIQRIQDGEEKVDVQRQAGFGLGLVQAAALLEQQDAELVKPGVAQGEAVFGFIHTEAAGAAGAGGEEDVAVADFVLGKTLVLQGLAQTGRGCRP